MDNSKLKTVKVSQDVVDSLSENSIKVYDCNVCGSILPWSDNHKQITRSKRLSIKSDTEVFITCKDDCLKDSRRAFVKWTVSIGYSANQGKKNFLETVLPGIKEYFKTK